MGFETSDRIPVLLETLVRPGDAMTVLTVFVDAVEDVVVEAGTNFEEVVDHNGGRKGG